ncbi:general substrate transporter [Stachybotrys elegans]|uniref:General substrate transporter n=1 Tax=Stachybotrys elegans TaxID=80388 RepID=A0A8K0T382_9HYPO|nr:general substrate transporter [Stachybotrys elegans]
MPLFTLPNYAAASLALSFGGFLNGYDTGAMGSQIHMPQFTESLGAMSASMTGITVSMVMLMAIIPSLFGGQIADKRGRLRTILPGSALFVVGVLLQATAFSLTQFIIGRAVSGAGQGIFFSLITVYITEIAPMRSRGRLSALPQFMATLGICVGYFCCYGTSGLDSSLAWRLPFVIEATIGVMLTLACLILPESPRWLLLNGRADEARQALVLLNFDMDEAQRDFLQDSQTQPSLSRWQSFAILFKRGYRSRTFLSLFFLSMIQLSGIDAITYYAPRLFEQTGITSTNTSLIASGVSSIAMFVVSIPAFMLADKWDRRTSTIVGGVSLGSIMLLMGGLYAAGAVQAGGFARWVVVVSVFLFGIVFCATWNIVGKIYASEIQASHTRAAGNSLGMAFSFFCNWLVAFITPILLDASAFGAYFLFAGLVFFGVVVLALNMPETRGRSLESIQSDFRRPAMAGISTVMQLLGLRRRAVAITTQTDQTHNDANIELQPQHTRDSMADTAATSGMSMDVVARGMRMELTPTI